MSRLSDHDDPFGALAVTGGVAAVPEITSALWDGRDNVDKTLPWVLAMVRASGLPAWWDEHIAAEKERRKPGTKAGRPRDVSIDAVLVGWLMCKTTRKSLLHTEIARFLLHTINAEQRALLGVPPVQGDPTSDSDGHRSRLDRQAVARRVGRLVAQMIEVVDPSPHKQARSRKKADVQLRDVTPEQRADAAARLDWAVTQILAMPVKAMPRWLRRQWAGDAAVDGTHVRLASRGATADRNAWDADGGWYVRAKATGDRHVPKSKGGKGTKVVKITKSAFALDLALVVACDATPGDRQYFPTLPLTLVAHRPSTDSIGHATRAFGVLDQAGVAKRYMAADRLYPHEGGDDWHVGLQEQGWQPVFDYRVDTLGRQGAAKGGLLLVEGQFHCPMTPDAAISATEDLRAGRIDHATYKARMAQRDLHRAHQKEGEDANGTIRLACPASGPSPKVRCPKRPASMKAHVIRQPDGTDGDTRTLVQLLPTRLADVAEAEVLTALADQDVTDRAKADAAAAARDAALAPNACDPKICRQESVSVRRDVLAKHRQALVYGSSDHKAVYRAARNAQEGLHGFAKDDAQEAVGNAGLRRKRGLAAQSLYAAVGFAVASLRKIVSFIEHARQDEQGRWYVPRNPRPSQYDDVALGAGGGYRDKDDGGFFGGDDPPGEQL